MSCKKAAVFIILGQSNAVGHGIPMTDADKITTPLKNVFGLDRCRNQTFDSRELVWSGYTSGGMNLAEEQDHTYSIPNCLARLWQDHIDAGNAAGLPDLYIIQIAIGAQGVTEGYMWHPDYEKKLIPGVLGTVDISLFPFAGHIFSLLDDSFQKRGIGYDIIGLHWRGGENDVTAADEYLSQHLKNIYRELFDAFNAQLGMPPIVLHRMVCPDRMNDMDPTGQYLKRMHYINHIFAELAAEYGNIRLFDPRQAPYFIEDVYGNGLFMEDAVHFTPGVNRWIAETILQAYSGG